MTLALEGCWLKSIIPDGESDDAYEKVEAVRSMGSCLAGAPYAEH
ncbi:hypothetical protein QFZ34_000559 [Phyllobacterium ifriqiyense]|uniref:Uncharacterized protein n=1 Tax=Phyllobacterium ifriqiyense TaxID=314238 RepID=A0ABU0S3R4_9HYPH|nr:hypothetical protein [Phyllobacterium ifriqiyense]